MKIRTLTILATILTISGGVFFSAHAQVEQGQVPTWFKGVAGYWAEGKISQGDFINAIQFLVSQKVITLPSEVPSANAQTTNQQTTGQTNPIIQGPLGPQGPKGDKGDLVHRDQQDHKVHPVSKDQKVILGLKDLLVHRDQQDRRDRPAIDKLLLQ